MTNSLIFPLDALSPKRRLTSALMALAATVLVSGCETAEDRQLASAQSCLDAATTLADANNCISMVQGLESSYAYLIRCSANFIAQGFNGDRMTDAFERLINDSGAGADPMATMMSYVVFNDSLTNHSSSQTLANCSRSGVTSMTRLATVASMATLFASVGNQLSVLTDPNATPQQRQAAIQSAITSMTSTNSQNQATLGSLTVTAEQSFCNNGSAYKGTEVCANLSSAVQAGNGNPETIGEQMAQLLNQNN